LFMMTNRFVDSLPKTITNLEVFGRKPTSNSFVLQPHMDAFGKLFVFGRVADEAGIELNRSSEERWQVIDEGIRHATAAQKRQRKGAGFHQRAVIQSTWTMVPTAFQTDCRTEIHVRKNGFIQLGPT